MKKTFINLKRAALPALLALLAVTSSCNSKTSTTDDDATTVTISTVAIKSFKLSADSKVLSNLDSVFFSIDLKNGVVFNADSLPVGTNVSKLVPVITFTTAMSKADIVMSGGTVRNDSVNYLENATDSIDFTGNVKLNVTSYDGTNSYTYTLKVNVHKQKPDSLMWDKVAVAQLPSRMPGAVAQKTVAWRGTPVSLIREADGSLTYASADDIFNGTWTKAEVTAGTDLNVESFASTPGALWALDRAGNLMTSVDGTAWSPTGQNWVSVVGEYDGCLLGIRDTGTGMVHAHWPADPAISDPDVDPAFPISGRSQLVSVSSKWADMPTAILVGGTKPSGEYTNAAWAFDGSQWMMMPTSLPAIDGAAMLRYVDYVGTSITSPGKEYDALYLLGGLLEDGNFNRTLYISLDNGVTWKEGGELTDLPDFIPSFTGADAIVHETALDADLADAWTVTATRGAGLWRAPQWTLDGTQITWMCPYIYLFGGQLGYGTMSQKVWRGALNKLSFQPVI